MTKNGEFEQLSSYLDKLGGNRPIRRILIANNGIAAVKFIRSLRSWSYEVFGDERMITFCAMVTPEDLEANAEYVRYSDEVCHVPGGSNVNNYANVNLIVEIAQQYEADAVWAGWGHASENPRLPNKLNEVEIAFIGPPGGPMHALGDKIGSTIIAQSADVPTIAWNGDGLRVENARAGISSQVYDKANVKTVEQAREIIERLGLPVMIKASEGGGGKGIRMVDNMKNVESAYQQVQSEIPGSPIFIMRLSSCARHLEVQLLADQYGQAIALSGRDCSVQRRHQKILEEGPPLAAKPEVWIEMEKAAVRLAQQVGYVNAGTVEYLYDENGRFYFLELNPRLQVEHPVTEMITGINIPACQLQVSMGIPLHRIPDIRKFYLREDIYGSDSIDFDGKYSNPPVEKTRVLGHTISARITAENPANGFQPTTGSITEINFRSARNVWGYFSVDSSGRVHEFADSQIGHIFAWGENREEARRNLAMALNNLSIRGEIHTTIEYLKNLIEVPDYCNNKFDTAWLDKRIKANVDIPRQSPFVIVVVGAAVTGHRQISDRDLQYKSMLERGQLPPSLLLSQTTKFDLNYKNTKYHFVVSRTGQTNYAVSCNNSKVDVEIRALADGGFLVYLCGKSHVAYSKSDVGGQRYIIDSQTCVFRDDYDPTKMRAEMGGKLLKYLCEDGALLKRGDPFAEIEVMKMTMQLVAGDDGIIKRVKPEGAVLERNDIVCTMELSDPSKVRQAKEFTGEFPSFGVPQPTAPNTMPHQLVERARALLKNVIDGYDIDIPTIDSALGDLRDAAVNPLLPVLDIEGYLSCNRSSFPSSESVARCEEICQSYRNLVFNKTSEPSSLRSFLGEMLEIVETLRRVPLTPRSSSALDGLETLARKYLDGLLSLLINIYSSLVKGYVEIETRFAELEASDAAEKDDAVQELRLQHSGDLDLVASMSRAYNSRKPRDSLMRKIIGHLSSLVSMSPDADVEKLIRGKSTEILECMASLQGKLCSDVALEARIGLTEVEYSYSDAIARIEKALKQYSADDSQLETFIEQQPEPILGYLMDIISRPSEYELRIRMSAMKLYIKRVYFSYEILQTESVRLGSDETGVGCLTRFIFYSKPRDAICIGEQTSGLSSASPKLSGGDSLNDLTMLLLREDLHSSELNSGSSLNGDYLEGTTDSSSVGMDLEMVDSNPLSQASTGSLNDKLPADLTFSGGNDDSIYVDKSTSSLAPFLRRRGALIHCLNFDDMRINLVDRILKYGLPLEEDPQENPVNVIHVVMPAEFTDETSFSTQLSNFLQDNIDTLHMKNIRRITFAIVRLSFGSQKTGKLDSDKAIVAGHGGHFFTFRAKMNFQEDRLLRNIETPLGFQLDLQRLSNFSIRPVQFGKLGGMSPYQIVHVFEAVPKDASSAQAKEKRYFVRVIVRQMERLNLGLAVRDYDAYPGPEIVFVQALRALETIQKEKSNGASKNHIFMNMIGESVSLPLGSVKHIITNLYKRYLKRLLAQKVAQVELRVLAAISEGAHPIPIRIVASNPTGLALNVDTYVEANDPSDPGNAIFYSLSSHDGGIGGAMAAMGVGSIDLVSQSDEHGCLHGKPVSEPYEIQNPFDERRAIASSQGTTFCFDFPYLFRQALTAEWSKWNDDDRERLPLLYQPAEFEELVLEEDVSDANMGRKLGDGLRVTHRKAGSNKIAMVAWLVTMRTPQYPDGRRVVLLVNDITIKVGSFGTKEDLLFELVSKYARREGIPRLYIAANSGARIGLSSDLKKVFKVKWSHDADQTKGFDYLYLDESDYLRLGPEGKNAIVGSKIETPGEPVHYKIEAIVGGSEELLGVENLRGSGTIAGETSRAYESIFTLSYVSGRSVGIGAYLNRLGQRVIQKGNNAPILLTGYRALNSLMGSDVYTSNLQLGGTKIMYGNGVSHLSVRHDLEGVTKMISWLSYIPERRGSPLPLSPLSSGESIDRKVAIHPSAWGSTFDPRLLLCGRMNQEKDEWISGFFDRGSFQETLGGWAKSVIVGRARLGGLPMGVIISETRTVEQRLPADPAAPDSKELISQQAGQVWYPDSSFKTAQAIEDFNREGLPLMLFANWRGFSGGTRDMMDQVLKFGAAIVDALVGFKQPCFVHIPPSGELRGGAWVVVDPTINDSQMEMTVDPEARGGVLEAPAIASVKFRKGDLIASMHRLDDDLKHLDAQMRLTTDSSEISRMSQLVTNREALLLPIYRQIAIRFADEHDKPARMLAKGVIRKIVSWEDSRKYFFYRLRRLLIENSLKGEIADSLKSYSSNAESVNIEAATLLSATIVECEVNYDDDEAVYDYLTSHVGVLKVKALCDRLRTEKIMKNIVSMGNQDPKAILLGMLSLIKSLQDQGRTEERDSFVSSLKQGLSFLN